MRPLVLGLLALLARPALSDHVAPPVEVVHLLTQIEHIATRDEIQRVLGSPVPELREIALHEGEDFGMRLRAVRALPLFCPDSTSCASSPAHLAILDVFEIVEPSGQGQHVLLARAAIEALGAARSGSDGDLQRLVPFLDHRSRDIRAASARAMRDSCDTRAIVHLRARYQVETVEQVRLAISSALRDLGQCQ